MAEESVQPISGLDLAEAFYIEAVRPILESVFPDLRYSAALIGSGSEVLGFDDGMSTDHDWGPRLMLFMSTEDMQAHGELIKTTLSQQLPLTVRGYSTHWSLPDENDNGTQQRETAVSGQINHRVAIYSLDQYLSHYLGLPIRQPIQPVDWLTFPCQKLRTLISGRIFHDENGLRQRLAQFAWYPDDVWFYIMAAGWVRIAQEEHLAGRAGHAGDELGSAIIASRLVRDMMRLAFLMERTYPPYPKWFGTAFNQLQCAADLQPTLQAILHAKSWQARDELLAKGYKVLASMHNHLGITEPVPVEVTDFFERPFTVINADRYAAALIDAIQDPQLKAIAKKPLLGNIDLITDNTDLLENPTFRSGLKQLFA